MTLNTFCSCALETQDTEHYFLCCQNNLLHPTTPMNDLHKINTATSPAAVDPGHLKVEVAG